MEFERGIEVIAGAIIENEKGELLLARSPKWANKWIMPGGHIEPGETIFQAAVREGEEETGLKLKAEAIVHSAELINSSDFKRPAHFVFFDVVCSVIGGNIELDQNELSVYKWLKPEDALKLDLVDTYDNLIRNFIEYKNSI